MSTSTILPQSNQRNSSATTIDDRSNLGEHALQAVGHDHRHVAANEDEEQRDAQAEPP